MFLEFSNEMKEAARQWSGHPGPPTKFARKRHNGVRMYSSPTAEALLGRVHPATPLLLFSAPILYGIYRGISTGRLGTTLSLVVAGILFWTLLEYVLHRFPFHLPMPNKERRLPLFLVHGYHHEYPDDPMRLVAPWPASISGAALLAGLSYASLGGSPLWWPLWAGILVGYVAYDTLHHYTHHARPKHAWGKWLRRYHMEHHYKDAQSHYGISSPLWDVVFGTFRAREVEKRALADTQR
ncbi:MAG: sterol desaturase family protein [Deltaproteobacteria bacterium]|nr:sterol desaturase family protein [Deltaproteobacteria bacterium]